MDKLIGGAPLAAALLAACMSSQVYAGSDDQRIASSHEATIYRDKMGVPHVYADNAVALFYAASYAIAHDRLAQSELDMRGILGRMAEIAGPDAVPSDKKARFVLPSDAQIDDQLAKMQAGHRDILKAMYAGWIARIREVKADPGKLPYEFKEWGIQPTEWSLHEFLKVMGGVARYYGTAGGLELQNLAFYRDLVARHGEAEAKKIFDDVLPLQDPDAVPIIPGKELTTTPSGLAALMQQQAQLPLTKLQMASIKPQHQGASRVLLIGAKKSATGNPIILQATSDGPELHISGAGYEAAGYVRSTMSAVIQGRTDTFAWSTTTGEDDLEDIFAETLNPDNPRQYFYKGAWRDMSSRHETIQVKGGKPVDYVIEYTIHGPVLHREDAAHVAYTVKNALAGIELSSPPSQIDLNRAKTFEDFRKAVATRPGSANMNYAGTDKRIAIIHSGLMPVRAKGIDLRLPTPGTGEYEWQGFVQDLPTVVDPEQGYLHAWNNKITADASYGDTSRYGKSFRTWLGRSLAESKDKITREDVHEFHRLIGRSGGGVDLTVTNPKFFAPYLRKAVAGDATLERAVAAMDGWNAIYEDKDNDGFYDSHGLTFYRQWIETAQKAVVGDDIGEWWHELDDARYIKYRTDVLLRAVEGADAGAPMKYDWYNGKQKDEVLRQTVADAVAALAATHGSDDPEAWRQPVFYRYYNPAAIEQNPDKPVWPGVDDAARRGISSVTAGGLGLQPPYVVDNGSEDWNMLVEVKKGDPVLYDSTPSGGQNLFISTDGKGNPNIADQVLLHQNFEFKKVDLDRDRVVQNAVSVERLIVPAEVVGN